MASAPNKRVAVIGAGLTGLVAIKECLSEGLSVQCFEKQDHIGGQWAYTPDTPEDVHSSMYHGCILNSCRDTSSFSDFPLDPARYPDYFSHALQLRYLNEYADHFGIKKHIRFDTQVLECKPESTGGWTLKVQEKGGEPEEHHFDALMCASGALAKPVTPEFVGRDSFKGEFSHSHYYRTPGPFEGKKVAIIGLGSSAVDIACEVGPQAKELHLITRRGGWILPRYILGKTLEAWDDRATQTWLPHNLSEWLQTKLLKLVEGKPLKELECDHKLLAQNPTIRGDFLEKVRTGIVKIQRASVDALTETGLSLSTGTQLDVDVIICATGYNLTEMPYLPQDAVASRELPAPHIDLYKFMISPWYDDLYVLGRVEVFGPLASASEAQARVASAMVSGKLAKPSHEKMLASIRKSRDNVSKQFINSPRHYLTVHSVEYIDDLLGPLGCAPSMGKILGRMFRGNPIRALSVFNAVYFGVPSSGQWRLFGYGDNEKLAEATVLRIARGEEDLSKKEKEILGGVASA